MKYRNRNRGNGNWNIFEIFISGVFGLITINYLIFGFADVVININNGLTCVKKTSVEVCISRLFGAK